MGYSTIYEVVVSDDVNHTWDSNGNWPLGSRDLPYGWAGEYSDANTIGFALHMQKYRDIVQWIHQNIKNPQQNARWDKIGDCIYVQIRKRTDWAWFSLRWS